MVWKNNIINAIALKKKIPLPFTYWILGFIRIVLTILPQNGYIHPDEYFQSIEIIAGDIFTVNITKPWEFDPKFPIRNIFVPKLLIGQPFHFINYANPYTKYYLDLDLKTPYFLLVTPRLFICILSFVNDYCLYKICVLYGQNFRTRLKILASSYVILVYCCRTLSNTIETLLFSVLLFLVADSMSFSDKIIYHTELIDDKYKKAVTAVERVKLFKLKTHLPAHSLKHVLPIATLVAIGTFNRPTFLVFAFPPVFFWLQRGLGSKVISFKDFHLRMLLLIIYSVPSVLVLILVDSAYYGYLTMADIEFLKLSWDNWVVTPFNFLRYNFNTKNLAQHGIHPRWLHFIVNIPLLFNVLGIIMFVKLTKYLYRFVCGKYSKLPRIQSITGLMMFSLVLPIIALSLFPHQEARFIIPVVIPLIYLYGNHLHFNDSDNLKTKRLKNITLCLWCIFNLFMTLFFGFIHQGGVYFFTRDLYKEIKSNYGVNTHVITTHMYSIPTFLLQLESTSKVWKSKSTGKKYKIAPSTFFNELGSITMNELLEKVNYTQTNADKNLHNYKKKYKVILVSPCSLEKKLHQVFSNNNHIKIISDFSYYPHFSSEALPEFPSKHEQICLEEIDLSENYSRKVNVGLLNRIYCYFKRFCLKTYVIQYQRYI